MRESYEPIDGLERRALFCEIAVNLVFPLYEINILNKVRENYIFIGREVEE